MAKRISELPAAGGVADTDEIEVNQAGVSRKATRGQVIAGLASATHLHDLADIAAAGALAALDTIGTAEIDAAAYASQSEAVAGTDNTKIMTALRTAEAIAAQATTPEHQHSLADITNAGDLAALDAIRVTEIDPSAYATDIDAAEGVDGTRIMTALRTAEAIAAQAAPQGHQHDLADIADAGALAALDTIGTAEIAEAAYASQSEAVAGTDNTKIMTALRTAEAIAAQPAGAAHQHDLADITDAGALAALDTIGTAEIAAAAFASQSEAVAGSDETKLMTALRTAEAIAAQAAPQGHQHDLADIADAGALAGLDNVGTAEIAAAAYASQSEALAGTDNTKIMTALRTAEAIAAQQAGAAHQHDLADITDAGALAALDSVGTAEIAAAAFASQSEAVAGTDNTKIMTALRTAEAIAAQAVALEHQHDLADIANAGALAALDAIRTTEIDPSAYATQLDAAEGVDGTRIMTAVRTAEAIAAQAALQDHQHSIADITDAGALAALDTVGAGEIGPNAVTSGKIVAGAVTMDKLADQAVVASKLASNAVTETKIASAAVTQAKIADGAVAQSKLAASAYASQGEAVAGTNNAKLMTPLRTAEAIAVLAAAHPHTLADITDSGALAALDAVGTGQLDAAAYASQAEANAGTDGAKLMTPLRTAQAIAARAERLFTPIPDEEDYSSIPFTVADTGNERRYFLDAHNHIIEFPTGLATDPAAHGVFTAPPGNTLTLRRAADSGVSINGVASNAYTWVVPAGGTVEWQVRATNTIELRGDTTAEQLLVGPLDANDQTIARPHLMDVAEGYADAGNKSGAASFNYGAGGWQKCVVVGNVTSVAVTNPPISGRVGSLTLEIHQDATGNRSIAWGAAFRFPAGAGSGLSTAANAIDIFTLTTRNGGTTWYVFEGGKAFAA